MLIVYFSGDFQIHFKDLDSESDDDDRRKSNANSSRKKARMKDCPGCGASVSVSTKQCQSCDYLFTSKSMLMVTSVQTAADESKSIRDKFPFEPERVSFASLTFEQCINTICQEEDGSLIIQAILGRRPLKSDSNRWARLARKLEGIVLPLYAQVFTSFVLVAKGLALADMSALEAKFHHEYLVKYKNLSYLHVTWLSATEIGKKFSNRLSFNLLLLACRRNESKEPTDAAAVSQQARPRRPQCARGW